MPVQHLPTKNDKSAVGHSPLICVGTFNLQFSRWHNLTPVLPSDRKAFRGLGLRDEGSGIGERRMPHMSGMSLPPSRIRPVSPGHLQHGLISSTAFSPEASCTHYSSLMKVVTVLPWAMESLDVLYLQLKQAAWMCAAAASVECFYSFRVWTRLRFPPCQPHSGPTAS